MKAKEELKQLYRMRELIDSKCEIRQNKYDLLLKVTSSADGMPRATANHDKVAESVAACADLSKEIDDALSYYLSLHSTIRKKIEKINNVDCRLVLEMRYLQFLKFKDIANALDKTERWVYEIHAHGLQEFSKMQ